MNLYHALIMSSLNMVFVQGVIVHRFKVLLHCAIFSATCLAIPFVTQVAGELHSVTGVILQLFLLHGALYKVEL